MRTLVRLFIPFLVVSTILFSCSVKKNKGESTAKKKPNVVVILADDQGWGATSVKMDKKYPASSSDLIRTPNLNRLAQRGVIFSNGYASHPNCSPTRASILTGKTPAKLQLTDIILRNTGELYEGNKLIPPQHINGLPYEEVTIAEIIKSNLPEYKTAHFGKWHLGNGGPEKHGFDAGDGETANREGNLNLEGNPKDIFGITSRAIDWMQEQVEQETPFYLQVSHYATHLGIEAKPETVEKIKQRQPGERHQFAKLAGMAEDLDRGVGMLLNEIEDLGISDNTYIIYLADNGTYPTSNTGNINGSLHGWKATIWEGGIRVPFMIAGPGISQAYSDVRVTGNDIYPTICDWLGIQNLPEGLEGGSLTPILKQPEGIKSVERENDFIVFHFPHYQLQKGSQPASTIIKGDYKLIKFYETEQVLLFNLKEDNEETTDLAESQPEKATELKGLLENYLESIQAGLPVVNENYNPDNDPGKKFKWIKKRLMEEPYFVLTK